MGRAKDGKQTKVPVSARIEPYIFLKIVKKFGSFTKFINEAIRLLILGGK